VIARERVNGLVAPRTREIDSRQYAVCGAAVTNGIVGRDKRLNVKVKLKGGDGARMARPYTYAQVRHRP
jgi:hypothetical protein